MNIRITLSRPTVKAMNGRLQQAYARGDVRLVRRISVLLEHLHGHVPLPTLRERWGMSESIVYVWLHALLLHGLASLVYAHGGGRPRRKSNCVLGWMTVQRRRDSPVRAGVRS